MDKNKKIAAGIIIVVVLTVAALALIISAAFISFENDWELDDGTILVGGMCICYVGYTAEELIEKSDVIVIATVTDSKGVWNTSDGGKPPQYTHSRLYAKLYLFADMFYDRHLNPEIGPTYDIPIHTELTFETNEILKGEMPDTFKKQMWGGTVDGFTFDNCTYEREIGQQFILFIDNDTNEKFILETEIYETGKMFYNGGEQISFEELKTKIKAENN
ncbi:hypothetical protein MsAg5_07060 [Methanosarcinaceae archaeon Ag5]|uniref:Uncharacterized protein n=1 Tax=Methanolapillus africanus TaxID=3028297 RepID=A0AAE4MHT6_9EURY|nr:hypothetical protein [Methanosarcinaceae archaeon Ag5]